MPLGHRLWGVSIELTSYFRRDVIGLLQAPIHYIYTFWQV